MDDANEHSVVIMEYLICAKEFYEIPINGRMRAVNWMMAGFVDFLPSVEIAMFSTYNPTLDTRFFTFNG